jgi:prevent-host-death family protein
MYYMETTARDFNQNASKILAAAERGERITVTKNGRPVAILSPVTDETAPVHPFRTDPMGHLDIPDLGGPALDDAEIEETLRGMGGIETAEDGDE